MIKVDNIYGIDRDFVPSIKDENPYLNTISKAIELSKSSDVISLSPGTYDPYHIKSSTNVFELTIIGSGSNSICPQSSYEGFFDLTFENVKIDNMEIISSSSNFTFRDTKFTTLNVMQLGRYSKNIGDIHQTYIVFDRCKFGYNYQIILNDGNYVISFKSCEITGKIPIVFARKGSLILNISSTDFSNSILMNRNCMAEIHHSCCNFNCPIYQGKETLVQTKDYLFNISPSVTTTEFFERERSSSTLAVPDIDLLYNKSENDQNNEKLLRELRGAIMLNSDTYPVLDVHKYTKLIVNNGSEILTLNLPEDSENGHILTIYSNSNVIINKVKYTNKIIKLAWIFGHGWWTFPPEIL